MIFGNSVHRHDQIRKEVAILRRDHPLMALQGKLILLLTADVPGLRHILRVFTHAPAGDAVLHLGTKSRMSDGRSLRSSPIRWVALRA